MRKQKKPAEQSIQDLMPSDPLMAIAWLGSVRYAIGCEEIVAAFRAETGLCWEPGRTPIDRMVDEACGADFAFIRAFIQWHNENIWGDLEIAP